MKVLSYILYALGVIILAAGIFALVVLIASSVNGVDFYEQLRMWFGAGSWFASIFGK